MTEQVKRGLSLLCWILFVIALIAGFYTGFKYKQMRITQPLGNCMAQDTVTVRASNVTYDQCSALCDTACVWVGRSAQ